MKEEDFKLMFNRLIATSILCLVLVTILLINVLYLNKQIKTLTAGNNQSSSQANANASLSSIQSSIDSLSNSVNTIKINTSQVIKPTTGMTCLGSSFGTSSYSSINLTCS